MGFMNYDRFAVAIIEQGLRDYESALINICKIEKRISNKDVYATEFDRDRLRIEKHKKKQILKELDSEFCKQLTTLDIPTLIHAIDRRVNNDGKRVFGRDSGE